MNNKRKTLSVFLAMLLLFCISHATFAAQGSDYLYGDVNRDGAVNIYDIMMLRDIIFGFEKLTGELLAVTNPDLNGDGRVNIHDILIVRNIIFSGQRTVMPMNTPSIPSPEEAYLFFEGDEVYVRVGETVKIKVMQQVLYLLRDENHRMAYTVDDETIASAQRVPTETMGGWSFYVTGKELGTTTVLVHGEEFKSYAPYPGENPGLIYWPPIVTIHQTLVVHVVEELPDATPQIPSPAKAWVYFQEEEVTLRVGETLRIDCFERTPVSIWEDKDHVVTYTVDDPAIAWAGPHPENWRVAFSVTGLTPGDTTVLIHGEALRYWPVDNPMQRITLHQTLVVHVTE